MSIRAFDRFELARQPSELRCRDAERGVERLRLAHHGPIARREGCAPLTVADPGGNELASGTLTVLR